MKTRTEFYDIIVLDLLSAAHSGGSTTIEQAADMSLSSFLRLF